MIDVSIYVMAVRDVQSTAGLMHLRMKECGFHGAAVLASSPQSP